MSRLASPMRLSTMPIACTSSMSPDFSSSWRSATACQQNSQHPGQFDVAVQHPNACLSHISHRSEHQPAGQPQIPCPARPSQCSCSSRSSLAPAPCPQTSPPPECQSSVNPDSSHLTSHQPGLLDVAVQHPMTCFSHIFPPSEYQPVGQSHILLR